MKSTWVKCMSFLLSIFFVSTLNMSSAGASTPLFCVGDCNYDNTVAIDELITSVNIALGNAALRDCWAVNANFDDEVTIDEIIRAVNNALNGCPRPPILTSTPTFVPTSTPIATSTEMPTAIFSPTPTNTSTPTTASTPTNTPTDTPVPTNTPTVTATSTFTFVPTNTSTATPSFTPTFDTTMVFCEYFDRGEHRCGELPKWKCEGFERHQLCTIGQVCGEDNCCHFPTPTPTDTPTNTPTSTTTPSNTPSNTATATPTNISIATFTATATNTRTPTEIPSNTQTPTPTPTLTPTVTVTFTKIPTPTNTSTPTTASTPTNTPTDTPVPTNTPTVTATSTFTATVTPTRTDTPTEIPTATKTPTRTFTFTPMNTPTWTYTPTVTFTFTPIPTQTATLPQTPTFTATFLPTATFTQIATATPTATVKILTLNQIQFCASGDPSTGSCIGENPNGNFPFGANPIVQASFHINAPPGGVAFHWMVTNPLGFNVANFIAGPITHGGGSFNLPTGARVECNPDGVYIISVEGRLNSDPFQHYATVYLICIAPATQTPTATNTPTTIPTQTVTPTFTFAPTATFTATQTPTWTPTAIFTNTAISTSTFTPTQTRPPTRTSSNTPTSTTTATRTATFTATSTQTASATSSPTRTPTNTLTPTRTATTTPSQVPFCYSITNIGNTGRSWNTTADMHNDIDAILTFTAYGVATYTTRFGLDDAACYAKSKGKATFIHLNIRNDLPVPDDIPFHNQAEIDGLHTMVSRRCVDFVIIGNNAQARNNVTNQQIDDTITQVRAFWQGPLTIGADYDAYVAHQLFYQPRINFLWMNALAFYGGGLPTDDLVQVQTWRNDLSSRYGLPIYVGEYGWPKNSTNADPRATVILANQAHQLLFTSSMASMTALYSGLEEPGLNFDPYLPYFGALDMSRNLPLLFDQAGRCPPQ